MVTFIGEYCCKIDDRGRLVLPAQFKAVLPAGGDNRFVVKKSLYGDCLDMYTYDEWTKQSAEIKASLDFFNPEHVTFWREYMKGRDVVEPDSKIGRISIDRSLLDAIGADREVVFFGVDFKIEIWAKEKFEQSGISDQEYTAIAKSLSRK